MPKSVVVIGGGIGGLSAAIHARLRGFDVVLLEATDQLGGKAAGIRIGGYRLDPGPSIVVLPRIYERIFADAGRRMDDYLRLHRLDPITQVRMEDGPTLELPADLAGVVRRLGEVSELDARNLEQLMHTFESVAPLIDRTIFARPFDRPWQLLDRRLIAFASKFTVRGNYKAHVDSRFASPLVRAFFYGFPSYSGQTYFSSGAGAFMIPSLMLSEGVFYPEGGVAAIPEALARLAQDIGVEVCNATRIVGLRCQGGRIAAAICATKDEFQADAFISNVDRSTTQGWLGEVERARPSFSYFTVHWGLRKRIPGLSHHNLFIPRNFEDGFEALYRRRQFPEPPIVYLNATSVTDEGVAPPGCENLFAVVSSPAEEPGIDWDREERIYRNRVVTILERFGVSVSAADIDFERVQTPSTFARLHGNYRGSLYGVDEQDRLFGGMFPRSNRDGQLSNLFYCGGSVQPGAGMPMVALSGKFAAELL